jgi:hypothetical protein
VTAATRVNKVVSHHVIARPHEGMDDIIASIDQPAIKPPPGPPSPPSLPARPAPGAPSTPAPMEASALAEESVIMAEIQPVEPAAVESHVALRAPAEAAAALPQGLEPLPHTVTRIPGQTTDEECCNLCGDPACPRRKGQPRRMCLHYAGQ